MDLGDKLKPCPFCGRKMIFIKEVHWTKTKHEVTSQYYMHEEYDVLQGECILDCIEMPFTLGAGDAREETGYIGEYAEKWNERKVGEVNEME